MLYSLTNAWFDDSPITTESWHDLRADNMPLGQTGNSLAAGQNPFLRGPFAGASGRLHVMIPVQHIAPQFQVLILTFTPTYTPAETKSALSDCVISVPCHEAAVL